MNELYDTVEKTMMENDFEFEKLKNENNKLKDEKEKAVS